MLAKVRTALSAAPPKPAEKGDANAINDSSESSITSKAAAHREPKTVVAVDRIPPVPSLRTLEQRADAARDKSAHEEDVASWVAFNRSEWVHKPVRMRVRRLCHLCNTSFASDRECSKCRHVLCDKCPRSPPKKPDAAPAPAPAPEHVAEEAKAKRVRDPLMKRASKSGGQDLIHRKPRQRVRRTCHQCQRPFPIGVKNCEQCGHVRCTDCPRSPAKKDKYPYGYPGDLLGGESAYFECVSCETVYPSDAEDGTPCLSCGCEKSEACGRAMPREVQPRPDLEVLNRLRATMDGTRA